MMLLTLYTTMELRYSRYLHQDTAHITDWKRENGDGIEKNCNCSIQIPFSGAWLFLLYFKTTKNTFIKDLITIY